MEDSCLFHVVCVCLHVVVSGTSRLYDKHDRNCLPFGSTWFHPGIFICGSVLLICLVCCVVLCCVVVCCVFLFCLSSFCVFVWSVLQVSLGCLILIAPPVFYDIYLSEEINT